MRGDLSTGRVIGVDGHRKCFVIMPFGEKRVDGDSVVDFEVTPTNRPVPLDFAFTRAALHVWAGPCGCCGAGAVGSTAGAGSAAGGGAGGGA